MGLAQISNLDMPEGDQNPGSFQAEPICRPGAGFRRRLANLPCI
jgi:hypothetical protein